MPDIIPCLWFSNDAEEAVGFYVSVFPDSRIDQVQRAPADYPGGKAGAALVLSFTLRGRKFMALNGGTPPQHTQSISFSVDCADQAEVDRYWDALIGGGGKPVACGWLTDRWGMSWQITPEILPRLLSDPDAARAQRVFAAMMEMVKIDVAALEKAAG